MVVVWGGDGGNPHVGYIRHNNTASVTPRDGSGSGIRATWVQTSYWFYDQDRLLLAAIVSLSVLIQRGHA